MVLTKSKRHKSKREIEEAALKKRLRPITRLLLSLTSDLDWGEEYADSAHPVHVNTKETMRQFLEQTSYVYPKRLSQNALIQHFKGERTIYFTGSRGNQTLVYIDPDCHKSGTKDGAFELLEYLKSKYFPNLYYEVSTHGNGGSGYIIVDTSACSEWDFNVLLKQLDGFLKRVLATTTFDVEDIEAKGAIPEVNWNPKYKKVIDSIKCGGPAKYPREMLTRADEFMNTTRLTTDELQAIVDSPLPELPVVEKVKKAVRGSILGKRIDPELMRAHLPFAREIMGDQPHKVGNRVAANAEDMAAVVTMIEYFSQHSNDDGSMPYLRFKVMWDRMYECGDLKRAWDNKRFAYLRNLLSDLGMIEWVDSTFSPNGRAMRWKASERLMDKLEECRDNKPAQTNAETGGGLFSVNYGFGGRILSGSLLLELKKMMEGKPIIRPQMVFSTPYKWFNDIKNIEQAMKWGKQAA